MIRFHLLLSPVSNSNRDVSPSPANLLFLHRQVDPCCSNTWFLLKVVLLSFSLSRRASTALWTVSHQPLSLHSNWITYPSYRKAPSEAVPVTDNTSLSETGQAPSQKKLGFWLSVLLLAGCSHISLPSLLQTFLHPAKFNPTERTNTPALALYFRRGFHSLTLSQAHVYGVTTSSPWHRFARLI